MISSALRATCAALPLLLSIPELSTAQDSVVRNTSFVAADGQRVLQHQLVVPATPRQVYQAFTTTDGVKSWAVPVAHVDFRFGGIWESSYRLTAQIGASGNIKNEYLSFVPNRMIAFRAIAAPNGFPHADLLREIFTVVQLDSVGPTETLVTLSMVGYGYGEAYDVLYNRFDGGNKWSMEQLHRRFTTGPVNWAKVLGPKE